ncbi:HTTM domain-containing protein [Mycobacterium sp. SMC-8]|uniref:HTTM domain-containing protein n=1 Tax=Mycobacterium sp. SMC-8 TaxID=2857060 RepID=UPI0021B296AF|nr:HTTM domain-containing protein [Mycobacterium sp. SMC-8]UXA14684.1 HTTM domain-containing protein [Mycobacterium sp. SMC-8]
MNVFRSAFGALCTLKAVSLLIGTVATAGSFSIGVLAVACGLLMAAAGIALIVGYRRRLAASVVVATGLMFLIPFGAYNHHLYLLILIALILAVDIEVALLLKIQLTIVYAFGTLAKVNDVFLSGTELHISMVERSVWATVIGQPAPSALLIPMSIGVVIAEGFLAVGFWFRSTRWVALVIGVGLHCSMMILLSDSLARFVNLLVYGGLMYTLYIPFFSDKIEPWWNRRSEARAAVPPVRHPADARGGVEHS